jgi:hypothetical protein
MFFRSPVKLITTANSVMSVDPAIRLSTKGNDTAGTSTASDAISDQLLWIDALVKAIFNTSASAHETDTVGNHRVGFP